MRNLVLLVLASLGCGGGSDGSTADAGADTDAAVPDLCDPLVPTYCAYPFPSDFWTVPDPTTPTGLRVALTAAAMPSPRVEPDVYNRADGFSPATAPLAHLPGATVTGLASPVTIARSLEPDSPTVILRADTGERVPHFAELDVNAPEEERAFVLRPVIGLEPGARYVVAIREVVDAGGAPLPPSDAFRALRDSGASEEPSVEARRESFEAIFATLASAGIARESLQLAWSFTVASREDLIGDMLHVRDLALAAVGESGAEYELDVVETDPPDHEGMALRVEGRVRVPLFMEHAEPGARLHRGADGRPAQNGTGWFPFWMLVPEGARTEPAGIIQYGHGMLGSGAQLLYDDAMQRFAIEHDYAVLGLDWVGFAGEDMLEIVELLARGEMHRFATVPDRLHQAMVNFMVALRTVGGAMAEDERLALDGHAPVDGSRVYYYGGSQGGIYGATYMALTPDIERGVLGVPGQAYGLMLERSVNFEDFQRILAPNFRDGLDPPMVIALTQMLWDRAEPSGYSAYIRNPLPDTPAHEVLLLVAIGDHQVTTLAAHLLARSIGGVPHLGPRNRDVWGLEEVDGTHTGSAMIEYDFGETTEPLENVPATEGRDPHSRIADVDAAYQTVLEFYESGTITNHCDGACDPD